MDAWLLILLELLLLSRVLLRCPADGSAVPEGVGHSAVSALVHRFSGGGSGQDDGETALFYYTVRRGSSGCTAEDFCCVTEAAMAARLGLAADRLRKGVSGLHGGYATIEDMWKSISSHSSLGLLARLEGVMRSCRELGGDVNAALILCERLIGAARPDRHDAGILERAWDCIREDWRHQFAAGYADNAPAGYDFEADCGTSTPWCRPWCYADEKEYRLPGRTAYECGRVWADVTREDLMAAIDLTTD